MSFKNHNPLKKLIVQKLIYQNFDFKIFLEEHAFQKPVFEA